MDILIISQYLNDIENLKLNNSRFIEIAKMLTKNSEHNVEILTSDFFHDKKSFFKNVDTSFNFKITTTHELGYKKNISIKRIISHKKLASNMYNYLKQRTKPDVVYCAIPSLDVASVASKFCKKNNIRFIIDIQDLWPEAFKIALNIPIISNLLFLPMKIQADKIYKNADEIVAVSKTYCDRASKINKKYKNAVSVFLGTSLEKYDSYKNKYLDYKKENGEVWLGYCGTLGHSYDLITVFDALSLLKGKKIDIKFIVMGDGPRKDEFIQYSNQKKLNCEFTGNLPYDKMCSLLNLCDIVVNPIVGTSVASIINKHADYAMSGLPVINTQNSSEYRELVKSYNMGFNCNNKDFDDMANRLLELYSNESLRKELGINARKCAEEKFDRRKTYDQIINLIVNCK